MNKPGLYPSRNQLSVITAVIVLAYALARQLDVPAQPAPATFFGAALGFEPSLGLLMMLLVATLISTGTGRLIRSHPHFAEQPSRRTLIHWILPGATALVLGAALSQTQTLIFWWLGLGFSALALLLVWIAEYIVVDPADSRYDAAAFTLTALAYLLAMILFVLLKQLGGRPTISAAIGGGVAALLGWRLFALRGVQLKRGLLYAGLIGLIGAQAIWALSYWRLPPIGQGLLAMIPFYLTVGVARQHLTNRMTPGVWIEFTLVGGLGLIISLIYALSATWQ